MLRRGPNLSDPPGDVEEGGEMETMKWTKKRVMSTDWQIREVEGSWPFEVFDPTTDKVMGHSTGRSGAETILHDLREYGKCEPS